MQHETPGDLPETIDAPRPALVAPPPDLSRLEWLGWVQDDQRARWQRGDRTPIEDYLALLAGDPRLDEEGVLDLIHAEVVLRAQLGESPQEDEYCRRFPQYGVALRRQFALHRALESSLLQASGLTTVSASTSAGKDLTFRAKTVPGYELLGELGRGGMGVVYKARQLRPSRPVALKMILAGPHADPGLLSRFRAEAEAVARLAHPNIVQIFEVGEHDGQPFFSLEFVEGGSLAMKLGGTPQPPREAAGLVETLARAVHAAHQKGVIHRDLKPANVLLTADGTPKVTDFGLAKQLDTDSGQTQTGQVVGTPSYMAPEQAEGRLKEIGPAADVYSLGAILYEMLTGRPPFKGATLLETLELVRSQDAVPPRSLVKSAPRDLETICLKCLQKDPRKRYATALELAEDLERFQKGEPVVARPVGRLERVVKWARRRPAVAALTAAVILVAAAGFTAVTLLWGEAAARAVAEAEARAKEAEERSKADAAREAEATARARAETSLYRSNVALAHREWLAGNIDRTKLLLGDCPPTLRGWEWHYVRRLCHTDLLTVPHHWPVHSVTFSPDGKQLLGADRDPRSLAGLIRIWDADTGAAVATMGTHGGEISGLVCSPDGKRLVTASRDYSPTVEVWDMTTRKPALTLRGHPGWPMSVAYNPDGKQIACAGGGTSVWDASTGRLVTVLRGHTAPTQSVAWSPDGQNIVAGDRSGEVTVWEAATGRKVRALHRHAGQVTALAYDRDGKRLASASLDRTVIVWDVATGRELRTLRGHGDVVHGVAFSADGRTLASAGADNTVRVWDAVTGEELRVLRGHAGRVRAVAFHPDKKQLASGADDRMVKVWDVTAEQEVRTLRGHDGEVTGVAFSPDGLRFVTGGADKTVRLWDAQTGKVVRTLAGHGKRVGSVATSPRGGRLASGDDEGVIKVWDAEDGKELHTLRGHGKEVRGLAFHPDGQMLASAGWDKTVRLWDAQTGEELARLEGHPGVINCVAWSAGGTRLVSGCSERAVKIWDVAGRKEVRTLPGRNFPVWGVAFSPDGRRVAAGTGELGSPSPGEVRIWDAATGEELQTLRGHTARVEGVAFSPDGRRLASAGGDKVVRVWDAEGGQDTLTLHGHTSAVRAVAFSPDGTRLGSAGFDGTLRVWDGTPLPERGQGRKR